MNNYVSRGGDFLNQYYLLPIFTTFKTKPSNVQTVILNMPSYMHERNWFYLLKNLYIVLLFRY